MLSVVIRTERFGGVFDHHDLIFIAYLHQRIEINRMAEGVHGDNRLDASARYFIVAGIRVYAGNIFEIRFQFMGIEPQGAFFAIDKMGDGAAIGDGVRCCHKCEGGRQYLIFRFDPGQFEGNMQGRGSVYHGDGLFYACEVGQHSLEFIHILPDIRYVGRVNTIFQICPFIAFQGRLMKGDGHFIGRNNAFEGGDDAIDVEMGGHILYSPGLY